MRSAHAATLFASQLFAAQLSNAWKQRSYPALWETTLRAFAFVGQLQAETQVGPREPTLHRRNHRRAEDCPPYRRAMLCLVGRFTP